MFRPCAFFVLALGFVCGGCGDEDETTPDAPAVDAGAPEGPVEREAPRTSSKPKMDRAAYEKLQQTEIEGFRREPGYLAEHRGVVHYAAEQPDERGGILKAMVAFQSAGMLGRMDPDVYEGRENLFVQGLDAKHRDDPDLVWSYGALDLPGDRRGVAQYVRSYVRESFEGRPMTHKLNSYIARYHDGVNGIQIHVFVHGVDATSAEEMAKSLDKDKGDAVARRVFAAFAEAFD